MFPDDIKNAKRVLFTAGEFDPVTELAPLELFPRVSTDRNASRLFLVSQGAHGEDSLRSSQIAKESVTYAQNVELHILSDWLGLS